MRWPSKPYVWQASHSIHIGVAELLLLERNASGRDTGFFLYLIFACLFSAPHGFYKTISLFCQSTFDFFHSGTGIGVGSPVGKSLFIHALADLFQTRRYQLFYIFQIIKILFPVVPLDVTAFSFCNIPGTDFNAKGNAFLSYSANFHPGNCHCRLSFTRNSPFRRPARICRFQYAFLLLLDRDDYHLNRCYCRGKN